MTEKDAKETLEIFEMQRNKYMVNMPNNPYFDMVTADNFTHSLRMAIQALEEVQQYRSIGAVEECQEAVERNKALKPQEILLHTGRKGFECRNCGNELSTNGFESSYCHWCGQRLED